MPKFQTFLAGLLVAVGLTTAGATGLAAKEKSASPYAGQHHRTIKSLSKGDIATLQKGGGWGFAKAAELNGLPGPVHVLELSDKLHLSDRQKQQIRQLFVQMRSAAVPLGRQLIAQERRLDQLFATRRVTPQTLRELVGQIGQTHAALRTVHLAAHLQTPKILSAHQVALYNRLRGYGKPGADHGGHGGRHKH